MSLKIERLFAFVAVDEHGDEGVMGEWMPGSGPAGSDAWMPYVGADLGRVAYLKVRAKQMAVVAKEQGIPFEYKVLEFELKGEIT